MCDLTIRPGETREAFIARIVATAPLPSPEVFDRLHALLHSGDATDTTDATTDNKVRPFFLA